MIASKSDYSTNSAHKSLFDAFHSVLKQWQLKKLESNLELVDANGLLSLQKKH